VAAVVPTTNDLPEGEGIQVHELPGETMATVMHHDAFTTLGPTPRDAVSLAAVNALAIR